jgi:uncharacterized protein YbbK (DUF523 family)
MRTRVLVSSCLLGKPVRYDGSASTASSEILDRWVEEGRVVSFCPEVAGGFPVPRPPAEIIGAGGEAVLGQKATVVDEHGNDVTNCFIRGSQLALDMALAEDAKVAVLKDGSPSCGSTFIHDGGFSGGTRAGVGVTTALLEQRGIKVFSEAQFAEADAYLGTLDASAANGGKT